MTKLLKIGFCFFLLVKVNDYNFNHRLVYEVTDLKNSKKNQTIIYLINKQDNSYNASQYIISEELYGITFLDQNGPYWKGDIKKESLNKHSLTLDEEHLKHYSNPYKDKVDIYDFIELKDTVLDNKICKQFMFKCKDIKREQKKKLGKEIYVIDTSQDIKPLLTFCTAYEVWKLRRNIPNGIIVEKYFLNAKNEMIIKEKLKRSEEISLNFYLPLD